MATKKINRLIKSNRDANMNNFIFYIIATFAIFFLTGYYMGAS